MWKCPNCETVNNTDRCTVCGQEMPSSNSDVHQTNGKIFCGSCGTMHEYGTEFCGECGSPLKKPVVPSVKYIFCGNCGERMPENFQTCTNCGQELYLNINDTETEKRSKKPLIIIVSVILIITAFISGAVLYNTLNWNNSGEKNESGSTKEESPEVKTEEVTAVETENGEDPDTETNEGVLSDPVYNTYSDIDYQFDCSYPSHFQEYTDKDAIARYSLKAPDDSARLKICAMNNDSGLTVYDIMYNFKSSYPGDVDYENNGNMWCAVSTIQNEECHYCFYFVEDTRIRGFEFHYDNKYHSIYDKYVNDIYDSLNFY